MNHRISVSRCDYCAKSVAANQGSVVRHDAHKLTEPTAWMLFRIAHCVRSLRTSDGPSPIVLPRIIQFVSGILWLMSASLAVWRGHRYQTRRSKRGGVLRGPEAEAFVNRSKGEP